MQVRRILVPTDFSTPSVVALNHAVTLARKIRASLTLLHVVELPHTVTLPETIRLETERSQRMLSAMIAPEDRAHFDVRGLVRDGDVRDEILSAVRDEGADLLVMRTHSRGVIGRLLIGSVTQSVLKKIDIPILTVSHVAKLPSFNRILFATDFSGLSNEASSYAMQLAQSVDATLIAVHAVDVGVDGGAEAAVYLTEDRVEDARAKLDAFNEEAARNHIETETMILEGAASDTILTAAERTSADVIMMTIRTPFGPVSETIIREAHVPVLGIPAGAIIGKEREPHAA